MDEMTIGQMFKLSWQRVAVIRAKGVNFTYENSARGFKALANGDNTMYAEPHAVLSKYSVINSAQGSCLVLGAEPQAGRILIKTATIAGRIDIFSKTVTGTDGYGRPYVSIKQKHCDTPYARGFKVIPGYAAVGDLIAVGGSRYEVIKKSTDADGLEELSLKPYTAPGEQPQKSLQDSYAWNTGSASFNQPSPSTVFRIRH